MADEKNNPQGERGEKKLHIDAGWKAEVQAEKERLEREERERLAAEKSNQRKRETGVIGGVDFAKSKAAGPEKAAPEADEEHDHDHGEEHAPHDMPPATFDLLVQSLASQAVMLLTPRRDPRSGRVVQDLDLAKHTIDLLAILEEKTKGNLTDDEKKLLGTVLYQVRMAYVQAVQATL
jgi:hypothetical protein